MPAYCKPVDIHSVQPAALQPGQWVFAGQDSGPLSASRGRYVGMRPNGAVVVAWQGNARAWRNHKDGAQGYYRALQTYAKGR